MKDEPVKDVPIEIKVMENHVLTISLDGPAKTNNHFGDTPIYGTVLTKQDLDGMWSMMSRTGNMTMMEKAIHLLGNYV